MRWIKRKFVQLRFWFRSIRNRGEEKPQVEPPKVIRPKPREENDQVSDLPPVPTKNDIKRRSNVYYEYLYATMMIKQVKKPVIERVVKRIQKNRQKYVNAEILTGVNWRVIAVIHNLEASGNFAKQILNGQSWKKRTTIVPKNQGPWKSWEESCVAAFKYHPLNSNNIVDVLRYLERYNGLGYIRKGINSPYLWSFSDKYKKGKYVADGRYSPHAVSQQIGAAVLLKSLGY